MTLMTVIRDRSGNVINIGDWDDLDGVNPLPADATSADEDVTRDVDGALRVTAEIPTDAVQVETSFKRDLTFRALIAREVRQRRAAGESTLTVQDVIDELKAEL
jgi:hypothetical protein